MRRPDRLRKIWHSTCRHSESRRAFGYEMPLEKPLKTFFLLRFLSPTSTLARSRSSPAKGRNEAVFNNSQTSNVILNHHSTLQRKSSIRGRIEHPTKKSGAKCNFTWWAEFFHLSYLIFINYLLPSIFRPYN